MAGANRRIVKELDAVKKLRLPCFRDIQADVTNVFLWKVLLMPDNPPYNKGAFWIEINFPHDYPLRPPTIRFKTKIYHPNVNEKGEFCLPIISAGNWQPYTMIDQVLQALIELVNNPDLRDPSQPDMAKEFKQDHETFLLQAEDHTCNFSEKRPCE